MLGANPLPSMEDDFNVTTSTVATSVSPTPPGSALNGTTNETSSVIDEEFVCAFYNPDFIIYSSLGSFYIPCVIMVFLYIRIFSVSILVTLNDQIM